MSSPAPESSETPGLDALRSWCGWHIAPSRAETVEVESDGGSVLFLPSLLVTDVTEVRDEAGDVVTDRRLRRAGFLRGQWRCDELYSVDLVHGYDVLPTELAEIVAQLDEGGVGRALVSRTEGPFAESYATSADLESQPISVRSLVARYRVPGGV
jgi:hypothetical protein